MKGRWRKVNLARLVFEPVAGLAAFRKSSSF